MGKPFRELFSVICLVVCGVVTGAQGQAILGLASTARPAISTDEVALVGTLEFRVITGVTGAGTVVAQFQGVQITNDVASGITVAGSGGLAGAAIVAVDTTLSTVTVSIPGGGVTGDSAVLDGVRVDVAASGLNTVSATVSASLGSGFTFLAGNTKALVVNQSLPGLEVVEADSNTVLSILGPPIPGTIPPRIVVREGFDTAFSDDIGTLGQTVATRVQILALGIPEGVQITFPMVVTEAKSGATLTAVAAGPDPLELTLPTTTGETTITYEFASAPTSATRTERFVIVLTLDVQTSFPDAEVVSFQATLFPAEAPNIPRFVTQLIPSDEDLALPEFEDIIPTLQGVDEFLGLALTSDSSLPYAVTLEAFSTPGTLVSGPNLVNPATLTLPTGAQTAGLLEDFFGSGIVGSDLGSVVVRGRRSRPVSLFFLGDAGGTQLDGATGRQVPVREFVLPNLGKGDGAFTILHVFNPSLELDAEVTLTLEDLVGSAVDVVVINLPPRGSFSDHASNIFQFSPESFQGRVRGVADSEVAVFETFGNGQSVNALTGQEVGLFQEVSRVPHFVAGLGFDTEVTVINFDDFRAATVEIALLDETGAVLPQAPVPAEIVLEQGEMKILSMSALFGLSPDTLVFGSIRVTSRKVFIGPVPVIPSVTGSVRFFATNGTQSATLPLFSLRRTTALYPHVAQNLGFYTGLAVGNPQKVEVTVTVEVFDENGVLVGLAGFVLAPGARDSRLLSQLVPASDGQLGGYFRVTATAGVISFALFGDLAGNVISVIPAQ